LTGTIDRCLEPDPHLRPDVVELGQAIYDALPELSHNLAAPSVSSRFRGLFGRTPRERSDSYTHDRPALRVPQEQQVWREPGSGRLWRFGIAALAAFMCVATMLAANLQLSFVQPLIAAALVFALPRAGWALAATAGAVALAIDGQVGSAMFLVLPAVVAAFAATIPLPRVFDGALAGAGAFAWVVAIQAMSGTSLALSLPESSGNPEDLRQYADIAAHAIVTFSHPAYTASLGLWSLTGAVAVLLVDRRAPLAAWAVLGVVFAVAQVVIGQAMQLPVPALSIVIAVLALVALVCAAAIGRRAGRVFAPSGSAGAPEERAAGRHVRA
jgi:hypothetical protein